MSTTQRPSPAVVVAIDGTGRGTGALRYAIDEARARGTAVRMVHVLDDRGSAGHEIMEPAMSQACAAAPDLEFDWLFGRGPRADELIEAAAGADLLVLGRAARQSAEGPTVGSVTAEVAGRADAPVVVVPADWQARGHGRIVVGIKSAATAGELLAHAFSAASARHAVLRVVHACAAPEPADPVRVEAHPGDRRTSEGRMLEALVHDWSAVYPDVEVKTSFVHGWPARVLVDAAADADVLMTARHHRDLRHLVRLGPIPREVVGTSGAPVEVVPLTGEPATAPLVVERSGTILKN
ncbi:universal stress protein [Promicromonospora soli]|uniref:Universal stress protein n=1 Tax=Promicromonospora soli TaxID=2035533 RepID=A0A919G4Q1_9MICO|nr:universal stress protein [Promicromonospora soli]GHH78005.1 universal stress protein [Promicromonospora soli]